MSENTEESPELKIGETLAYKEYERWGSGFTLEVATVERFTKTQVILSNGARLRPVGNVNGFRDDKRMEWVIIGQFSGYKRISDADLAEWEKEKYRRKVNRWVDKMQTTRFTEAEKAALYEALKEVELPSMAAKGN